MEECSFINAPNLCPNLNNQQFRLKKSMKVKVMLLQRLKKGELMSKLLCKHIASFDYFDRSLTVLSAKCGSISIT